MTSASLSSSIIITSTCVILILGGGWLVGFQSFGFCAIYR
jgi:hypothetical protein